ncbi:MAG: PASTA domain-containing protein [Oscillospiraceae bacterium]|jgi:hypothetical protein
MRTIVCKKCGEQIDASLGICPFCGTTFPVLPEDEAAREKDKELEWAMSMDDEPVPGGFVSNENRPQDQYGQQPGAGKPSFGIEDIENADNDELFNTRVWKNDPDATRAIGQDRPRTAAPPVSRQEIHVPPRDQQEYRRPARETPAAAEARARAEAERRKQEELHKKKIFVTVVAIIAALTLLLSIIGGVFDFGKNTGTQTMPNVVGYTAETAKNVLENEPYKLKVVLKTVTSDKTANTVVEQSIEENKKIKAGDSVTLSISDGKGTEEAEESANTDYAEVPDLRGKTYEQARAVLGALGLEIARNDDVYSDQDAGTVVAQTPMKGAKLQKGDLVTVTVSKGQIASPSPTVYTITVTAGKGGSVSPKGSVSVPSGSDQTFTFTPASGYVVKEVKVDGKNVGAVDSYTFPLVEKDHTLYVVFEKKAEEPTPPPAVSTPAETPPTGEPTA